MRRLFLAALLVLSACGPGSETAKKEDADTTPGVSLTAEEAKSLGVATVAVQATQYRREVIGYGVVTALDSVAQSDADFATASAAAAQSQAAAARARSLAAGDEAAVSREVVEAAQSKAAADQAALMLARRKAEAAFGVRAPWRDANARQKIMARLGSGHTVLVHVTFPLSALASLGNAMPSSLKLMRLGTGAQGWTAQTIWDAPADPALPGRSFYALVDGSDLAQNEHVTAAMPVGAAQAGVTVPAEALVLSEGQAWVYLQTQPNHFQRSAIDTAAPQGDGYFVKDGGGIAAGQKVVTSGAGLLLAREINPSTEAGD